MRCWLQKLGWMTLIGAMLVLQTGCWDRNELETLAFVLTMGVDRSADNQIDVIMRIGVPGNIGAEAGKSQGESIGETSKPITVTARSIPEAISLAEATVERRIDFRHLRVIIFGEELAKEGIMPHLDVMERFRQFRRTVFVWVAKDGPARDVFLTAAPVLEKSVSRYVDGIARGVIRFGYSRMPTLHDFLSEVENEQSDSVLPLVGINPTVASEKKDGQVKVMPTEKYHGLMGGKEEPGGKTLEPLHRSGGNPSEFLGVAVMQEGRMIDKWSGWEARVYGLLRDTYRSGIWVFESPARPGTFAVQIRRAKEPALDVTWEGEKPHLNIHVFLEGELMAVPSLEQLVSPEGISIFEDQVVKVITKETDRLIKKAQKEKADPFYFARFIQMRTLTMQEFDRLDWKNRFSQATYEFHIEFEIRRPGLRIQPFSETQDKGNP
ncbi:Ger(x)C family spore germination protein [Heliobacterium gestii]|uniref:Ger(X)C family spore germination protein n=1 Tax=Heliomicrobium gestii TaxID=2699 RepID=A0A845LDB7_HELGE|nr:Ger(x)C family spore germination protein [Heliomicrobium gestii]MBM7865280.1 Ger(x)C family germination protein [Heliomicrobium gestii]MZP41543.1 Ger(x)C family spore germination protein [Heliomicrobium gestii]